MLTKRSGPASYASLPLLSNRNELPLRKTPNLLVTVVVGE